MPTKTLKSACEKDHARMPNIKYCPACGKETGSKATPNPNCAKRHAEYKKWEEKFCPDCGERL